MSRNIIILPLLALTAPALAQTAEPADQARAETIVVTGRGFEPAPGEPAYGTVELDREDLERAASGRVEDVLQGVAGFQQFRRSDSRSANPSAQGATLRGLGGNATSRSLVLLDGVPQANPFFGYIPFSALPPERLGAVRVTRGGGSGAFGAGAVAGTIALDSAGVTDLSALEAAGFVNDRGETQLSASIAPRLGSGFAVVSGRWDRGKGFFTTPRDQRVPATARAGYDSWSVAMRGVAPIAPGVELQARAATFDDERTLRFAGADSTSSGQDFSVRAIGGGAWKFDVLGFVQARDFSNVVISSSLFTKVLDQRDTPSTGLGGKVEIRPPVGEANTLRIGADARIADGELREDAFNGFTGALREQRSAGGTNSNFGAYLENDVRFGNFVATGGVRVDRSIVDDGFFAARDAEGTVIDRQDFARRTSWDTSLRGGLLLELSDTVSVRGAAYSGLRLPTLNELYRPFVVFPVVTQANADLENEKLRGYEAGIDIRTGTVALSVTAFDNRLKKAITNVTVGENLRQRRNIDAIDVRGIEAEASARFGLVSLQGSAAWLDAKNDTTGVAASLDDLRPAQVPRLSGSATASVAARSGAQVALTVRHEAARFEDDLNTTRLPSATTLDAFASVPLSATLSVVLRGENLWDEEVVTRNSDGALDLGTPRTIWLGVRTRIGR